MNTPLRYDIVVGTGGLGTGMFLTLDGDRTLGREESRAANLLDQQDRCKLHNVTHYVKVLLGPLVDVVAVGRIGDDEPGRTVLKELRDTGFDTSHVQTMTGRPTLFSVCFTYPNGDGGNLTLNDTASAAVSEADMDALGPLMAEHAGRGVALAAPEVPLEARRRLLELAGEHGFLRVASFLTAEIPAALEEGVLALVDVLSVNIDEAAALSGADPSGDAETIARSAIERLRQMAPALRAVITAGGRGSWLWDGAQVRHTRPIPVTVVNTAGAGDAHVGGLIVGLVAGLQLAEANELATVVSAQKVTSIHTINPDLDVATTLDLARRAARPVPVILAAAATQP